MDRSDYQSAGRSLAALLDAESPGRHQIGIVLLCALIAMLDGFDTQCIGFTAPAIAVSLHLAAASFGPIFASGLAGGLLGALAFGRLADRIGRKRIVLATMLVFGTGSLLTPLADSAAALVAFRFITGLGLGGAMPSIISMTAEYSPRRYRATIVTAMFCGFPLGAVIGAIASTGLLSEHGWQAVFLAGGLLPMALLPAVAIAMPESIRWLAANGRRAQLEQVVARMGWTGSWDGNVAAEEPKQVSSGLSGLFAAGLARHTLLLWCTFFLSLLLVYLLVSWIPTIAQQTGRRGAVTTLSAAALNLGGILGSLCFGRWADRSNPFRVVSPAYAMGAAVLCMAGLGADLAASIYWVAALVGFFCIGAQLCVVAIASDLYPPELRATGVGWAMGVGRLGAICGPLIGGYLMRRGHSHATLFGALAATSAGCAVAVFAMRTAASRSPVTSSI